MSQSAPAVVNFIPVQQQVFAALSATVATLVAALSETVPLGDVPQAVLTPAGGAAPTSISLDALINNGAAALPSDFTSAQYAITDPGGL